jgi:hypothetical protein
MSGFQNTRADCPGIPGHESDLQMFAVGREHQLDHLDVVTAFLNPIVDDDNLFMKLPTGFMNTESKLNGADTARLYKALYGLKTAPRLWFEHITMFLTSFGFQPYYSDSNLFKLNGLFLVLYVDDMVLSFHAATPEDAELVARLKTALQETYHISNLGNLRKFLGIYFVHAPDIVALHQLPYIQTLVKDHPDAPAISMLMPLDRDVKLWGASGGELEADKEIYGQWIGRLG